MALSCEVVGRLLFSREDEIKFIWKEIPDEVIYEESLPMFVDEIEYIRDKGIAILQDRTRDIYEWISDFLSFVSWKKNIYIS